MALLLDSAPAVDLRRSTRLPLEVLESIHAFLPRDWAARSPLSTAFRSARKVDLIFGRMVERRIKCRMCRRMREEILVFDAKADCFELTRFCRGCESGLKKHWKRKLPWHRHYTRMRSREEFQDFVYRMRVDDLEILRGFKCIVRRSRRYASDAFCLQTLPPIEGPAALRDSETP